MLPLEVKISVCGLTLLGNFVPYYSIPLLRLLTLVAIGGNKSNIYFAVLTYWHTCGVGMQETFTHPAPPQSLVFFLGALLVFWLLFESITLTFWKNWVSNVSCFIECPWGCVMEACGWSSSMFFQKKYSSPCSQREVWSGCQLLHLSGRWGS